MIKKNTILKSPGGMRSYLPGVATELNIIEKDILEVFSLWGYQPVITPTLEYFDSLTEGMGRTLDKKLYKFIDYEGNILALRPEMTAPIARTLSTRLNEIELPLRLSYSASVFRYEQPQTGKNREIYQLGVEFIGEKNYLADAEAIILAIESLEKAGLKEFKIDVGHAAYLNGIIRELELDEDTEYDIKNLLNRKDLVGLNNFIQELSHNKKEILKKVPFLRGGIEVLTEAHSLIANIESSQSIEHLRKIYDYIKGYGYAEYITFDLSLIRGFDYYTGVVFEGFTEKLGYTICGGGRYDNLLEKYSGQKIPAIGFAIGLERVRLALKRQGRIFTQNSFSELIVFNEGTEALALSTARKLRERGFVTMVTAENQEKDLRKKAENMGVERVLHFLSNEEIDIYNLGNNNKKRVKIEEGWEDYLWEI